MDDGRTLVECFRQQGNEEIGLDKFSALIDKHAAVGVAVEDDAAVQALFAHNGGNLLAGVGPKRIRRMVRERAVGAVVQIHGSFAKERVRQDGSHAVGTVHGEAERRRCGVELPVRLEPAHIFRQTRLVGRLAHNGGGRRIVLAGGTGGHEAFHLRETGRVSHRERAAPRNLETVVGRRIVRSRDHHRCIEILFGSKEIDHGRRGRPQIGHVRAGGLQPRDERTGNGGRRGTRIAPDQHAERRAGRRSSAALVVLLANDGRQMPTNPVNDIQVEIYAERPAHVVSFEE